jgi:hypothetical protein
MSAEQPDLVSWIQLIFGLWVNNRNVRDIVYSWLIPLNLWLSNNILQHFVLTYIHLTAKELWTFNSSKFIRILECDILRVLLNFEVSLTKGVSIVKEILWRRKEALWSEMLYLQLVHIALIVKRLNLLWMSIELAHWKSRTSGFWRCFNEESQLSPFRAIVLVFQQEFEH